MSRSLFRTRSLTRCYACGPPCGPCCGCGPCGCSPCGCGTVPPAPCGCGPCGCTCLPPPSDCCSPKCLQNMLGYYYYPYGTWFCGPYHQKVCCAGGPCTPCGGPCGCGCGCGKSCCGPCCCGPCATPPCPCPTACACVCPGTCCVVPELNLAAQDTDQANINAQCGTPPIPTALPNLQSVNATMTTPRDISPSHTQELKNYPKTYHCCAPADSNVLPKKSDKAWGINRLFSSDNEENRPNSRYFGTSISHTWGVSENADECRSRSMHNTIPFPSTWPPQTHSSGSDLPQEQPGFSYQLVPKYKKPSPNHEVPIVHS